MNLITKARPYLFSFIIVLSSLFFSKSSFADVTLTTAATGAGNINQGSTDNIIYAVKMDVTISAINVNNIQFTLTGTHDNNDLTTLRVYFNAATPTVSGATLVAVNIFATFAAPHTYSSTFNTVGQQTVAAGASGYFIITAGVDPAATNGNTVILDGAANPVVFGYTSVPTVINNQSNIAGTQTILAAGVTLTTSAVSAANIPQGSTDNIVYAVKMDVASLAVAVNSIQFTLTGTHDNNDLTTLRVYFNAATPTVSGATLVAVNIFATFAAPHTYNSTFNTVGQQNIASGASGYFIITASVDAAATNGNTVILNGAANPVVFGYTTSPVITNNQSNIAGTQTILAAGVTLTTSAVSAANITQGSTDNIIYAVKMDVASLAVAVNSIQFNLTGTHDNNDLTTLRVYFNAAAPTVSGATLVAVNITATFAAPHTYNSTFNTVGQQNIASGASGYFIITANVDPAATNGNTIILDGAANPVVFGYTTSPVITNNQTNIAGTQTILAAGVTLTTSAVAAANIAQGTNDNIVYAVKMDVASLAVAVNSIQFTLTGTHDNNDLTTLRVYFNAAAPTVSGATLVAVNITATFAAPHTYNSTFNTVGQQNIASGASGYFIITANVDPAATNGNTIILNGAANPVVFGYTTSPVITNNQSNISGTQTILAAGVTLTTSAVAAANIAQGSTDNIIYAVKMDVTALPVTVNNIQFTLTGTFDNNDLVTLRVYFNSTPTLSGATLLAVNIPATFAAPHTFSSIFNSGGPQTIASGSSGYFMITANVDPAATNGNTVKLNGAANPVVFSYTTAPANTNNQSDLAGTQTILASGVTLSTPVIAPGNILLGSNDNILYAVRMDVTALPVTVNNIQFTLTGTFDNNDLTTLRVYFNTTPTLTGATLLAVNIPATFAAPHTFSTVFNSSGPLPIAAGASGYFIITANVDAAATVGNTVILDGAANPVVFSFTTAPPITNNQTNVAGPQSIASTLPLTLINFAGAIINTQQTQLQWTTLGELNTKNFDVEWSTDGILFNKIGMQPAATNSLQSKLYYYIHKTPVDGNNFYRLKMNDQDGRFIYSPVIKVKVAVTITKAAALQNPVTDILQLQVQSEKNQNMVLNLYSADGKMIASKPFNITKGSNRITWNVQALAAGNYLISSANHVFETIKIVKQ